MTKPQNIKQLSKPAVLAWLVAAGILFRRFQLRWGATVAEADGGLPGVTDAPPESVLWSPGVRTQFGRPELGRRPDVPVR